MLGKFLLDKKGNFGGMCATTAFPLLVCCFVGLDYANIATEKVKLRQAVDAAILQVGSHIDQHGELPPYQTTANFVKANYKGNITAVNLVSSDSELTLTARADVGAFFFGATHPDLFKLTVVGKAFNPPKSFVELALVLDTTGSMDRDVDGEDVTDSNGRISKMDQMKFITSNFVQDMLAMNGAKNDIKFALVPFNNYVNVGPHNGNESWVNLLDNIYVPSGTELDDETEEADDDAEPTFPWSGCVGARALPDTVTDTSPSYAFPGINPMVCSNSPIVELTSDKDKLLAGINLMEARGQTYVGEGVAWGLRVLSPAVPFTGGEELGNRGEFVSHKKVILLLSDGKDHLVPRLLGTYYHDKPISAGAESFTKKACQGARDAGVTIYSIGFGAEVGTEGAATLKDCAGDDDNFFDASDADALQAVFDSLIAEVQQLRLTH